MLQKNPLADLTPKASPKENNLTLWEWCDKSMDAIEDIIPLLEAGADVNYSNPENYGNTCLMLLIIARKDNAPELVREFIQRGADVNLVNSDGQGPVHWASYWGKLETVKDLLAHGANFLAKDKSKDDGLTKALQAREFRVALEILQHYQDQLKPTQIKMYKKNFSAYTKHHKDWMEDEHYAKFFVFFEALQQKIILNSQIININKSLKTLNTQEAENKAAKKRISRLKI